MVRRKHIATIIAVLVVAAVVRADMMPVGQVAASAWRLHYDHPRTEAPRASVSDLLFPQPVSSDLWQIHFLSEAKAALAQPSRMPSTQVLTDTTTSLSLCLYALMGLGLYSSAHWIKKHSFQLVPEWYHAGGPFQIGHSLAVTPDDLCPTATRCFLQPTFVTETPIPIYHAGTREFLWRKSQFAPAVLVPRGPPVTC